MRWAHALMSRLRLVFRRDRLERELDAELQFHLEQQIHENIAAGMSAADARAGAWRSMGGIAQVKEQCRDSLGVAWLDDIRRDLNYAVRALRRSSGFSAAAILTLALGIGATTTIFSFVNAVLLNPLAYPDSNRLVVVAPTLRGAPIATTPGDFLEWQVQNHSFAVMAAGTVTPYNLTGRGEPIVVLTGVVSDRWAETLGVPPQLGQTFALENQSDRHQSVIISDRVWRRRFNE